MYKHSVNWLQLRRPFGFSPEHDEDLREPLVRRQGSQVSMRVARGRAMENILGTAYWLDMSLSF